MKKLLKKVVALALVLGLCLAIYEPVTARADELPVTKYGGPWKVAEGVTAVVENGVMRISGTGEIPDYNFSTLYQRPWDGAIFEAVIVEDGITKIGSYAFYGYKRLKYVTIPSTVFIQDSSSLGGLQENARIRITGTKVAESTIGSVPYTSAMSIVRDAQDHPGNMYLIDYSYGWKALLMTMTYPSLTNIYYANNEEALKNRSAYTDPDFYNASTYSSPLKYAKGSSGPAGASLRAMRKIQGYYLYLHLSNFLSIVNPGFVWGTAYSVDSIGRDGKQVQQLTSPQTFVFDVPADLQRPGRVFKVMILTNNATGEVVTVEDLDMSDKTITFTTDKVGVCYALIYQDIYALY